MGRSLTVWAFFCLPLCCASFSSILERHSLCVRGWDGDGEFIKKIIAARSATSREQPECFRVNDDAGARQGLWIALQAIETLIKIATENLNHADDAALRGAEGLYFRQVATVAADGTVRTTQDTTTPPRLVYDPEHPDAITTGPQKGYVLYPNVNARQELKALVNLFGLHNSVAQALMRLDPSVIIAFKCSECLQEFWTSHSPALRTSPGIVTH
jgi:hypothetical protein